MIDLGFLDDRPYAVLGLGRSGRATARALVAAGRTVMAWDDDAGARATAVAEGVPIVDLRTGVLGDSVALVLSPGIPHTHPAPHPIVARAKALGIEVYGDIELLFRAAPEATFVGVTGTNGKSTTTALIGHILAAAGADYRMGGNLGPPVLDFSPTHTKTICVLEMSSYQLELTPSLVFNVAVLLNISPDHLNRHGGLEGYITAKRRIFAGESAGGTAIVGVDDAHCRDICRELTQRCDRRVLVVSGIRRVGGGAFAEDGILSDAIDGGPKPMLDLVTARALPGAHNGQNAAAAYVAACALGIDREVTLNAIADFPGLAHRQEAIGTIDGVTYVNDSKATNGDAAVRALVCYDDIHWIAGGRPKEDGLEAVLPWLDRVSHAYLIGEAEEAFARDLDGRVPVTRCGTLDRAVAAASGRAEPGSVVLLSPACASFDQFANFEARGDAFRALVEALER
ncbi:MAG: UDP-N-acetylmuramoyl-L-alanine--D-glutamate ligase [Rhodospirillales bacterium]|nr:UDP-N-acetylmuramoyl-L-alanine--D-glutamate ligase [Rhodospirillales bacterium]